MYSVFFSVLLQILYMFMRCANNSICGFFDVFLHSFRELSLQLTNHSAASSLNAGHHWDPIFYLKITHTKKENTISRHVVAFRIDWESFPGKTKSLMRHCWPLLEKAPHTPEYSRTKLITAWIKKKILYIFHFFPVWCC